MPEDFYGFDDDDHEPKGRDNLFLWTVFILLLIGAAFACWLGSFYIFGHPENPRSYRILKKLGKIDVPQRFEVTAAPQGEFLNAQKLFERYGKFTRLELERENAELLRNYLKNYKETKRLTTYVTGKYVILRSAELKKTDLFTSGVVALAQAADFSQVLIEHVYTAAPRNVPSLRAMLQTGLDMKIVRTDDLSAVIHIERVPDGRMQFTVVPLLYGSYTVKQGSGTFSLEPPTELNLEPGLPVIKGAELQTSLKAFAEYRSAHPASPVESATDATKPPSAPELVRVDTVPPGEPVPPTGAMPAVAVATPIPIPSKPTPTPKLTASARTPSPAPGRLALLTTPQARPLATPLRGSTPFAAPATPFAAASTPMPMNVGTVIIPPATPEPPKVSPSGVKLQPFIAAQRDPTLPSSGATWRTYPPGQMPPAKIVVLDEIAPLAERGEIGERIYLRGDFRVTASGMGSAVLRDANKPDDQSPRVVVKYPSGSVPPQERDRFSRDASRPYLIDDVRRGADGVVTIRVREITQQ